MISTIIELSFHTGNFVLEELGREKPEVRVWQKTDVTITTQNCHFSKNQCIYLPSCIASVPMPLSTLAIQLSKSVEKNLAYKS